MQLGEETVRTSETHFLLEEDESTNGKGSAESEGLDDLLGSLESWFASSFIENSAGAAATSAVPTNISTVNGNVRGNSLEELCQVPITELLIATLCNLEKEPRSPLQLDLTAMLTQFLFNKLSLRTEDNHPPTATVPIANNIQHDVSNHPASANATLQPSSSNESLPFSHRHSICALTSEPSECPRPLSSRRHTSFGVPDDDWDRTVYVSWIPRDARATSLADKAAKQYDLKLRLTQDMNVAGLNKVLLFPPRGSHAKFIFASRHMAEVFIQQYGGTVNSSNTMKFRSAICRVYGLCKDGSDDLATRIASTNVLIEWCLSKDSVSIMKEFQHKFY